MRYIIYSLVFGLSFTLLDLNLLRRFNFLSVAQGLVERENKKEKKKRKLRLYNNRKHCRRQIYYERSYKYNVPNPVAHRYRNQRALRRMYRNG